MTRTTRADLTGLVQRVESEAKRAGILPKPDALALIEHTKPEPYRLRQAHNGVLVPFEPADGNGGDIGRTAREAEHTLRIMWATLRTVNRKRTQ